MREIFLQSFGVPLYCEPHLEWQFYQTRQPDAFIAGRHRFEQLVFQILVAPTIVETDPGPLDARVS